MLEFMIDTDTVSYIIRGHGSAPARVTEHLPSTLCISTLTLGELRFGAERRRSKKLHGLIDTFTRSVQVLPFDEAGAAAYGRIQALLETKGTPIGTVDTLIGAHAFALNLTLVTNNQRHFSRIRGLKIVNWSEEAG